MIDFVKGLLKMFAGILVLFAVVYSVVWGVGVVGVYRVLTGVYLLIGFMIAWETRDQSGHRLWFLIIPLWVPVLVWGFKRRSETLNESISKGILEEVEEE